MSITGRLVAICCAVVTVWAARGPDADASASEESGQRPNFSSDVAPILHVNCVICHRPGTPAPFSLLSYDEARAHAKEIRAAVTSRNMPPWSAIAASGFPDLLHDRRLSAKQITTVASWIDAGMPAGDLSKAPLPPSIPASWMLGLPDLTLTLPRPVPIPADPAARVINVVLFMNFETDRWITGIDYQPTSRDLLSHAVVLAAPATMPIDDEDALPGFAGLLGVPSGTHIAEQLSTVNRSLETLGVWTPAGRVSSTPDRTALRLPKGHNIVLQFNVRPTDTGAIEDGTLALYFSKTPPASPLTPVQVPSSFGIGAGIDLPAGQARVVVRDEFTLPIETVAFGARGHAHDLARDLKMTARLPNGSLRGLLWIDRWSVNWQETYYFAAPVRLPKGTTIQVEITYDNSAANPRNRSQPPRRVTWGPTLTDEVGAMDLLIATPAPADAAVLASARAARFREQLLRIAK